MQVCNQLSARNIKEIRLIDINLLCLDLKPANIIIDFVSKDVDKTTVHFVDWGTSQPLGQHTKIGTGGTTGFTAPEMLREKIVNHYNEKIDIFAMGCVLFEFLTGEYLIRKDKELIFFPTIRYDQKKLQNRMELLKWSKGKKLVQKCIDFDVNARYSAKQLAALWQQ